MYKIRKIKKRKTFFTIMHDEFNVLLKVKNTFKQNI
jgi:hypothetical protein